MRVPAHVGRNRAAESQEAGGPRHNIDRYLCELTQVPSF